MDVRNPSCIVHISICIILTLSLYATTIKAQENKIIPIQGIVTGEYNIPLPGVNIREKGTSNGTITDNNGRYNFDVPDESTLVFSFVGYTTEEIPVGFRSVIDIALPPESTTLQELVVVGYGVQEMGKVTGSAFSLANGDFNRGIINAPADLYQGKIPGVDFSKLRGEPGFDAFIRIMGGDVYFQLYCEECRRQYFIRFDQFTISWANILQSEKFREVFTIHPGVLASNSKLKQNPGYPT